MKSHIKVEHFELLTSYVQELAVVNDISRSQSRANEG
jgi:hypothetical protein